MGTTKSSYASHTCCIKMKLDFCLKFADANPLFSKFFKFIFIFDHYDISMCCDQSGFHLSPQLLKPCGIGGGVTHRVLNVPVSQVILNKPRIRALIGEGVTARMA